MDLLELSKPFAPSKVRWRIGSTTQDKLKGMALAYIDARDVMQRLDDVCGVGAWQAIYDHVTDKGVVCRIGVKVGDEWVWKSNGAGETAVEGEKGSMSDAFKRAAVLWGVGRYLYDLGNIWVELEARGRSQVIKKSEYSKLENYLKSVNNVHGKPPLVIDQKEQAAIAKAKEIRAELDRAEDKPAVLDVYEAIIERIKAYPEAYKVIEQYV